jgi:hypothetical protein
MPDVSKEQSNKVQAGSKEDILIITLKLSSLKNPCSETQVDRPNLGDFRILANGR